MGLIADIALSVNGGTIAPFIPKIMAVLVNEQEHTLVQGDDEHNARVISKRESILDAYTGLLHSLRAAGMQDLLLPDVNQIVGFINTCSTDIASSSSTSSSNENEAARAMEEGACSVLRGAVGLIGDLAQAYGSKLSWFFEQASTSALIARAIADEKEETRIAALWARGELNRATSRIGGL